jgi:C4-dicarboxylate-specific signal transduction histidine kinase
MKDPILEQERYPGVSPPFKIAIIYALGALTGLLLPDELLRAIITNPTTLTRLKILMSDSQGHVLGIMGVMDDKPMSAQTPDLSILKIFAARAGAERERKRAEQKARQHEAELAHMARLNIMGEMATSLAHELNQPLSAIVNYTHGCVRRLRLRGDSSAELLAVLEQVCAQAERAGEIIRRVRNFVRKQGPQCIPVDINALIREVASFIESDVNRDRIMLRFELAQGLAPVIADKIEIEQVVLNLLRNAIDAIKSAASYRRELILRTEPRGNGTVEVSVSDIGIGIPADMVEQVFEPFVTTKRDGMGMGLSISRSIIDTHGGRLWTEPRPGGGAVFRFTLPIERSWN